ncbi:hypothetical protein [Haloarchaeobius amylolyticus]|uniref:hypothetical protein n=1 Tax=Haloarchaeobius amylolyticus TaxID=1198296 RepID=UPI00226F5C9F|nr:hypothetical protein [Haloarchaeobius amylolyticus]
MNEQITRKEVLSALRVVYDPQCDQEMGVQYVAVADLLGADHSRVYHPLESLADDGLIEKVTKCRSGVIEKGFRPASKNT